MIDERTQSLAKEFRNSIATGEPYEGHLETDERIIARVTDGIYREPWSALRELVSNAYDADAKLVTVNTDYPSFTEIRISDDGIGMSPEAVAHLVTHIGGSSKRTPTGKDLGVVHPSDSTRSPSGRPLIGKIGIGLFAVAQLTNHFQIITQRKGDAKRTSATIRLNTYSENKLANADDGVSFDSGTYSIIVEDATEEAKHGTMIVLMNLRPEVRRQLQSAKRWEAVQDQLLEEGAPEFGEIIRPTYHIGKIDSKGAVVLKPSLPWTSDDDGPSRFEKLFAAAGEAAARTRAPANLAHFDNYLQMMWKLSLAAPLRYIHAHPFDMDDASGIWFYKLSNKKGGTTERITLGKNETLRRKFGLQAGERDPKSGFSVVIDGVELHRPIHLPSDLIKRSRIPCPLMFVGSCETKFSGAEEERSGGALAFEAYLYWNSQIVPKENIGVLVRINGAGGGLFDPEFLSYQVSEQTRKKQVTCEIFVSEGLDSALNIDRESFNYSHPHLLYIQQWLHNAFRQLSNRHKSIGKELLDKEKTQISFQETIEREEKAFDVWSRVRGQFDDLPIQRATPSLAVDLPVSVGGADIEWPGDYKALFGPQHNSKVRSVAVVLEAYGLLSELSAVERGKLLRDLMKVLTTDG